MLMDDTNKNNVFLFLKKIVNDSNFYGHLSTFTGNYKK